MAQYIELRRMIKSLSDSLNVFPAGFQFDYVFDWTILKYQQSQMAAPPSRPLVIS